MLPSLTIKSLRAGGNYSFSSGERKYIPYPEFPTTFRAVKFLLRLSGQERQLWQLLTLRLTSDLSDCRPPARLSIRRRDLCQQLIRQKTTEEVRDKDCGSDIKSSLPFPESWRNGFLGADSREPEQAVLLGTWSCTTVKVNMLSRSW